MNLRPEAAPTFPLPPGEGDPKGRVREKPPGSWAQFVAETRPGGLPRGSISLLPPGIGIYTSRIDRHSRASGNPDTPRQYWIPAGACPRLRSGAGMTVGCCGAMGRFLQNHWVDELCRYPCPRGEGS